MDEDGSIRKGAKVPDILDVDLLKMYQTMVIILNNWIYKTFSKIYI